MTTPADTSGAILEAAQAITQTIGYNGLSFRDVAAAIGIKSASVHYHYPTKAKLGAAIARRYTDNLLANLQTIDALRLNAKDALAAYIAGIRRTLEQNGRMCLCGMLAAETDALPDEVRAEVRRFVEVNVDWLARTIGRAKDVAEPDAAMRGHARAMLAALEGAMLIARGTGDIGSFDVMTQQFERLGLLRI
ncbi:MAG: TetR/AcrR family transcriptional regulator [Beijerinckiaceae bacterium]|nr:TetR/AcrR family transcriptional regulator [Beijerinckiaceae bacterium]